MLKVMTLITNLIIIICESYTFLHLKNKRDIFKYYTYLHNFFALISSVVLCFYLITELISGNIIPEFVRGLRYVTSSGLVATTFIFVVFLEAGKRIAITDDDFLPGFSSNVANIILHYLCPILSLISFVVFEREISLSNGVWTSIVAIPSCVYWLIYIILSATKKWEEPYDFVSKNNKNSTLNNLSIILIPIIFVIISYVLWNIK